MSAAKGAPGPRAAASAALSVDLAERIIASRNEGLPGGELAFVALHVAAGACQAAGIDHRVATRTFEAMLQNSSEKFTR